MTEQSPIALVGGNALCPVHPQQKTISDAIRCIYRGLDLGFSGHDAFSKELRLRLNVAYIHSPWTPIGAPERWKNEDAVTNVSYSKRIDALQVWVTISVSAIELNGVDLINRFYSTVLGSFARIIAKARRSGWEIEEAELLWCLDKSQKFSLDCFKSGSFCQGDAQD